MGTLENMIRGKEGVSGECPKGNRKRKSPASKTLPCLKKEDLRRARGISVLPNLSLGKRDIYQDPESS